MAEKYGFFDAVVTNGVADRVYSADDINNIFSGILSDGIVRGYENALKVTNGTGLDVNVDTGKAIVKNHWYVNTTLTNLKLNTAHATLSRYSSVVLRYHRLNRSVTLAVIDGVSSSTPTLPVLTQNSNIYEIRLANILVEAGSTGLADVNIVDVRTYAGGLVDAPKVNYRRYDYKQTIYAEGQRYFDIPASYKYTVDTNLQVYVNGLMCSQDEYGVQVNEVEGNYMVVFNTAKNLNSTLTFIMID